MARIEKLEDVKNPQYLKDRIARNTALNAETGCLEWTGKSNIKGYGAISIAGHKDDGHRYKYLAHRVAWLLHTGVMLPAEVMLLHGCDNPSCLAIAHLRPGTHAENMQDMHDRGRAPVRPRGVAAGEKNGRAVLTAEDAKLIRDSKESQVALAKLYGVTQSTISLVKRGLLWNDGTVPVLVSSKPRLTKEQFAEIAKRIEAGESYRSIAADLGISLSTVSKAARMRKAKR